MNFVLTEEQTMLQDQVRSLMEEKASPEILRELITAETAWSKDLWDAMSELGLMGAAIPEEYGGVGLSLPDLCVITEELGRAVAPVPYFSSICLAAEAIILAGSHAQKANWLPKLASGEMVATFAWTEGPGKLATSSIAAEVTSDQLSGKKTPVPDASIADICIVAALKDGVPVFALVELNAAGVSQTALDGFDQLRHHASIEFDAVNCEVLDGADGEATLQALLDRAAVLESFEQLGGIESALYMARDYTLERYIFGRQLGSYQSVKHNLANILVQLELARANALYAAGAVNEGLPDAKAAAAAARVGATKAYEKVARENLQLHGGIGFTWEANCHFHYRRARLLALNLGSVEVWADKLIEALVVNDSAASA